MDIRDAAVEALFAEHRFAVMCHLAAQMDVRVSVADPQFDASVNVLGLLNLLEAGRTNGLEKVAFASTGGAIYGEPDPSVNGGGPQPESHPTRPLSPYGITKLVSEHYLRFYEATHGIGYAALRFGNVYGPRQNPHGEAGVVAIFAQRLLRGEDVTINGDGKQTRDYVFVGDVVRAFVAGLAHDGSDIYNVGTGVETDVNELFGHINTFTGAERARDRTARPSRASSSGRSSTRRTRSRRSAGAPRSTSRPGWRRRSTGSASAKPRSLGVAELGTASTRGEDFDRSGPNTAASWRSDASRAYCRS